jgi:hypothetical protein
LRESRLTISLRIIGVPICPALSSMVVRVKRSGDIEDVVTALDVAPGW